MAARAAVAMVVPFGAGLAVGQEYALWPETWRARPPRSLAATIDQVAAYLRRALDPGADDASVLRRRTFRRLGDLRTALHTTPAGRAAGGRRPPAELAEEIDVARALLSGPEARRPPRSHLSARPGIVSRLG